MICLNGYIKIIYETKVLILVLGRSFFEDIDAN